MRKRRPSRDSKQFAGVIDTAGRQILDGFERSSIVKDHHPTTGGIRETGLRDFLRQLLPDRYYVGAGFAFDANDVQSRQLDVIVALEPPLARVFEKDSICYLPCEVVLAGIEVKKTLDADEVARAIENAKSIRALRPFGVEAFGTARQGGAPLAKDLHGCFYSLVAFSSDLAKDDWAKREWGRLKRLSMAAGQDPSVIDRVVMLDRGQINAVEGTAIEDEGGAQRIAASWFIHVLNHLEREAQRRKPFDPDIYTKGKRWTRLE